MDRRNWKKALAKATLLLVACASGAESTPSLFADSVFNKLTPIIRIASGEVVASAPDKPAVEYEAAIIRLSRSSRGLALDAHCTYGHAMDWNPNEGVQVSGSNLLDPTDFRQEYGTSNLDVRHSALASVILQPKWKRRDWIGSVTNGWMLSGIGRFRSGLPFTMRTSGSLAKEFTVSGIPIVALGTGMSGYGGESRVYGVGRNTYRYPAVWKADMRIGKRFNLGEKLHLDLLAESFNLFNHQNVTELETIGYSIESGGVNGRLPTLNFLTGLKTGQTEFGQPLNINATDSFRERQIQFGARASF